MVERCEDEWATAPDAARWRDRALYAAKGSDVERWDKAQVVAQSLVDGTKRVLIEGGSDARYLPTGHLVYALGGTMFAVPFDAASLMVTGTPVPVDRGVRRGTGLVTGRRTIGSVDERDARPTCPGPASASTTRSL